MKFQDIKVGDTVITTRRVGVNHGWGQTAFARTFNLPTVVTKTTATEFTVGGERYKKSGYKVGSQGVVAYLLDEVKDVHTVEQVTAYVEKIRRLNGRLTCTLMLNKTQDVDVAIKALDLIDQARQLLGGDL